MTPIKYIAGFFSWCLSSARNFFDRLRRGEFIFTAFVIAALVGYEWFATASPTITYAWYFNTEEFPYIQEILRFIDFDFRQQFFDIPGTPLIMLGSLLWFIYYKFCSLIGSADLTQGIRYFTFEHIQLLYVLMRTISFIFFAISILLTYSIARRLTNSVGGYVAALLLALSPVYSSTLLYLRIESTSLAMCLLSVWLVLKAIDLRSYSLYFASGIFAGLTMATRFPSVLAVMPVVLAYCLFYPVIFPDNRLRFLNFVAFWLLVGFFTVGGSISLLAQAKWIDRNLVTDTLLLTADGVYPNAFAAVHKLWMILLVAALLCISLYIVPKVRPFASKIIYSSATTVCIGFAIGLLLGLPTVLWSGNYLLASVEMFIERNKLGQSFINSFLDVIKYYLFGADAVNGADRVWLLSGRRYDFGVINTIWQLVLFVLGLILCFIKQRRIIYPMLLGIVVGLVGQYGKLQSPRHIIAWMPYFFVLMALPIALLYDKLKPLLKKNFVLFHASIICLLLIMFATTFRFQAIAHKDINNAANQRAVLLPQLDQWIAESTSSADKIFHSCCETVNQETIFDWMERNGLKIPEGIRKSRSSIIWFGEKETLVTASKGYIVITTPTYQGQYIDYYKKMRPESVVEPDSDKRFSLEKVLDSPHTHSTFRIYKFDFSGLK